MLAYIWPVHIVTLTTQILYGTGQFIELYLYWTKVYTVYFIRHLSRLANFVWTVVLVHLWDLLCGESESRRRMKITFKNVCVMRGVEKLKGEINHGLMEAPCHYNSSKTLICLHGERNWNPCCCFRWNCGTIYRLIQLEWVCSRPSQ